jgi:precorrin-8X/cobalt-precorrin-8 methylmutase
MKTMPTVIEDRPGLVAAGREIEQESFRLIDTEMADHGFPGDQWPVVRRVIHTTGDPDYAHRMRFHVSAISSAVEALHSGAAIYTDTRMIQVGLSPWRLEWFGTRVVTPVLDPESQSWAEEQGTTRSVAAFRRAGNALNGQIVAVGNAPTALMEVLRLAREEGVRPALVIGAPVGFVQAEESKDSLFQLQSLPSITVLGRKGGSTVAVAILHALLEWTRAA